MKNVRRGLGIGRGSGYYNIAPMDSHIHSLSAKGVKTKNKFELKYKLNAKTMDCDTFKRGINNFRDHPLLFNRLLEKHLQEHPNCKCNIKYINLDAKGEIYDNLSKKDSGVRIIKGVNGWRIEDDKGKILFNEIFNDQLEAFAYYKQHRYTLQAKSNTALAKEMTSKFTEEQLKSLRNLNFDLERGKWSLKWSREPSEIFTLETQLGVTTSQARKLAKAYLDVLDKYPSKEGLKFMGYIFNAKGLKVGTQVEMEHTSNPKIARKIAQTHLKENKDYYKFYDPKDKKAKENLVTMHKLNAKTQFGVMDKTGKISKGMSIDISKVKSDDPLAYSYGYFQAKSGQPMSKDKDLAPEYIRGYKDAKKGVKLDAKMTVERAKHLKYGDIVITPDYENADGTPQRWKVTGKPKLWKKDPNRIRVPIKRGLYEHYYITQDNIDLFDEPF